MSKRLLWLAAPLGVAAGIARRMRRRGRSEEAPDPRAEQLRRRLDESREIVSEREEFESGETPVDSVEDRRRGVHERGREAIDEIRSDGT